MCSLTNEMRVFRPKNPSKAICHGSDWGPFFYGALSICGIFRLFDRPQIIDGTCLTEGHDWDDA